MKALSKKPAAVAAQRSSGAPRAPNGTVATWDKLKGILLNMKKHLGTVMQTASSLRSREHYFPGGAESTNRALLFVLLQNGQVVYHSHNMEDVEGPAVLSEANLRAAVGVVDPLLPQPPPAAATSSGSTTANRDRGSVGSRNSTAAVDSDLRPAPRMMSGVSMWAASPASCTTAYVTTTARPAASAANDGLGRCCGGEES